MITTSPSGSSEAPTQNSTVWKSRVLSFFSGAAPVLLRPAFGRAAPAPRREPLAGVGLDVALMVIAYLSLDLSQVGEAGLEAVGAGATGAEDHRAELADIAAREQ